VSARPALVIGAVGGVLVVLGVVVLDRLKIDDPVGAFPVHGINGIWGTLAIGLFGQKSLGLAHDGLF
jgi:Amt family ammonium transporter